MPKNLVFGQAGVDCPKTKVGLSTCTKNECKNNWKTFEKGEILQKNCAEYTSANEFSDSLWGGADARETKQNI